MEGLRKYFPLSSSDYPEPAASKIGQHIKSTATPEEWAAIQCLGGVTLDSVTLMNSSGSCQPGGVGRDSLVSKLTGDCGGAYALTETFQSALAHALEDTPSPSQNCTAIKSLKLKVTFLHKPRTDSEFLLGWAYMMLICAPSETLLCPGATDSMVKILAVAQPVQGIEVYAEGFGAATDVTTNVIRYSERRAVFVALAEALKAMATDLKKQADEQCKANEASPLTDSLRFRCGEAS